MANRGAQLHPVTEIAPPQPFLFVNQSPTGMVLVEAEKLYGNEASLSQCLVYQRLFV